MTHKLIDLHTHSLLSDGELLPSELVRRAAVNGVNMIAVTDHVDHSNIDIVIPGLVKAAREINKYWDIKMLPGVEITHVPVESIKYLVSYARKKGAKIVVVHGESPAEPVIKGTNRAAVSSGADILAHPGFITEEDARLAAKKGICLEITTRRGHKNGNKHVFDMAQKTGAKLVLNTDSHTPEDILTAELRDSTLRALTDKQEAIVEVIRNSENLVKGKVA